MNRYILTVLTALPFAVEAETLYVQYEGRVLNVDEREGPVEGYEIGDSVAGTLRIDTDLAPLNLWRPPPDGLLYYGGSHEVLTNFVAGFARDGTPTTDFVGIERLPTGLVKYGVVDGSYPQNGAKWISIDAASPKIKEVTLSQAFDVKAEESGSVLRGVISLGKRAGLVLLGLSRMSVTPGQCRPSA